MLRGWVFLEVPEGFIVTDHRTSKDRTVLIVELQSKEKGTKVTRRIRNTPGVHRLRKGINA